MALIWAAKCGDLAGVRRHLGAGCQTKRGCTALMYAAKYNHLDAVRILCQTRELGAKDYNSRTALMYAAKYGHTGIVRFLCQTRELGAKDHNGRTALMIAIDESNVESAVCLALAGETGEDHFYRTALMHAIRYLVTDIRLMTLLISREARKRDLYGCTALMYAAQHDNLDAVKLLVAEESGLTDRQGRSALIHAVCHYRIDIARVLIAAGEAGFRENRSDRAALGHATNPVLARMLIAAGEDPYEIDPTSHRTAAERFGLRSTQPATLQMLCLMHIHHDGRRVGLWHPDLPPALRESFWHI